jgi:hypothetical protein
MIYIWCYALCRLHTLNHTDAKVQVACQNVRLWHWCDFLKSVIFDCSPYGSHMF